MGGENDINIVYILYIVGSKLFDFIYVFSVLLQYIVRHSLISIFFFATSLPEGKIPHISFENKLHSALSIIIFQGL